MEKSILRKPSDIKDVFGAFLLEGSQFSKGMYDMPVVKSNIDDLPKQLISYSRVGKGQLAIPPGTALHFYVYDYLFDGEYGIWNSLIRGTEFKRGFNLQKLQGFDYIIVPDFSLYLDMPVAMQIWNIYRSRVVAYALQQLGYKVIINVRWTDENSYKFCFNGIEKGSIVSVGSYGCSKNKVDMVLFNAGLEKMIKEIKPSAIIFYGTVKESTKELLEKYEQRYIAFSSDTAKAMEKTRHGNESK
ncbi:MAG: DUF4417 domain-containing protein [Erysipelotrichaceae bacterium]|nr:DUF4417 domain-containing protein [Erysipelotrichaceae bacterium]